MSADLPKAYDPSSVEPAADKVWLEEKLFHAEPTNPGKPYAIVIPPPNVTAALHLGHALNNAIQDILTRWHRMLGDNTVWIPGTDHAGIATQTVVEKRVLAEEGKRRTDFSREEFVKRIQAWKDEYEQRITDQLKRMGCSCDWDRQAFTMDEPRARAVREAFFRLFKDGLIYRGKRLVNWDPVTQTALADDEVEMEEVDGHFYYLRYPIVEESDEATKRQSDAGEDASSSLSRSVAQSLSYVTVATTRPETMLGDTAVAINPKDPRAAQFRGKKVRLPIVNRIVPIIEDDYVVLPNPESDDPKAQFATGFLKVTPAHDPNDWEIGQRHKLPVVNVFSPNATISKDHGWPADDFAQGNDDLRNLLGMDRFEARQAIVEWFRKEKLLEDVKPYRHSVGHSYRSHVPIEPYLSDQWYVATTKQIPSLPDIGVVEGTSIPKNSLAGMALRALESETSHDRQTSRDRETSRDRKGAESSEPEEPLADARGSSASRDASASSVGYLITYTCYGTWLHGDQRGSADREHNLPGTPYLVGDETRERREFQSLKHLPVSLSQNQRQVVQDAIIEVALHRGWNLLALHVRMTHVHAVVIADVRPEKVMNDFKAYATRRLREAGLVSSEARVWTRHGSTRYLNDDASVEAACRYVLESQGAPLAPPPFDGCSLERQTSRDRETSRDRKGAESSGPEEPLADARGSSDQPLANARGSSEWEGNLRIIPERYSKPYQAWHENIRDWCISRQLWWGHRIPVWSWPLLRAMTLTEDAHPTIRRFEEEGRLAFYMRPEAEAGPTPESITFPFLFLCVRDANDTELISFLERHGWNQDPDVLDTWFSSALWPLSTLGWPDEESITNHQSPLNVWNPTNTLCTAREIITLWVSRMVMFNLYFLNRLPFYDVFVHAMIQDGEGRKMSKSLGNGVDPVDIIESHGADAMRFTLASMTTHTQDVRMPVEKDEKTGKNTSPKFDIGRNFCNKLWNATRFALMNLQNVEQKPTDGHPWALADRWIVSRFNRAVADATGALESYRFDAYAKACYDFFWGDFCDWYLEAIKPAMKDPSRAPQAANVLAAVLDGSLRLMHPLIPFITEFIYWKLSEVRPERGLPGHIMGCTSKRLIVAAFPRVGPTSDQAERTFARLQEIIAAIRNVRNEYKVDPKKSVAVSILAPDDLARAINENREIVELLGTCTISAAGPDVKSPRDCARALAGGAEIFIEGLIDREAEAQRVGKRREELNRQISALRGRLSNESYIAKAPAHLVQQTRDQLAEAEAELAKLD